MVSFDNTPYPELTVTDAVGILCDTSEEDAQRKRDALTCIVEEYDLLLHNIIKRAVPFSYVEDVAQSTWVHIIEHIGEVRNPKALTGWVTIITKRKCIDWYRSSNAKSRAAVLSCTDVADNVSLTDFEKPDLEDATMIAVFLHETQVLVHDAIAELPEQYRSAVLCVDIQGMEHADAAMMLGVEDATVRSRLWRGHNRMKDILSSFKNKNS